MKKTFSQKARAIVDSLGYTREKLGVLEDAFRLRVMLSEAMTGAMLLEHGWTRHHVKQATCDIWFNPNHKSVHLAVAKARGGSMAIDIRRNETHPELEAAVVTYKAFAKRAQLALNEVLPGFKVLSQNSKRQYVNIGSQRRDFVQNRLHNTGWVCAEVRGTGGGLWTSIEHPDMVMVLESDSGLWLTATHISQDAPKNKISPVENEAEAVLTSIFGDSIHADLQPSPRGFAVAHCDMSGQEFTTLAAKFDWYVCRTDEAGNLYLFNSEVHTDYVIMVFNLSEEEAVKDTGDDEIGIKVMPKDILRNGLNRKLFANRALEILRAWLPTQDVEIVNDNNVVMNVSWHLGELVHQAEENGWVLTPQIGDDEREEFSYQRQDHPGMLLKLGTIAEDNDTHDISTVRFIPTWAVTVPFDKMSDVDPDDLDAGEDHPEADIDEAEKRNLDRLVLAIQRHVSEEEAPHRKGRKVFFARGAVMHEVLELVDVAMFSCDHYSDGLIQDMERTTKKRVAYIGVMEGVKFSLREKKSGKIVLKARGTSKHVLA